MKKFYIVYCIIGGLVSAAPQLAYSKQDGAVQSKNKKIQTVAKASTSKKLNKKKIAKKDKATKKKKHKNAKAKRVSLNKKPVAKKVKRKVASVDFTKPNALAKMKKVKTKSYWSFHCPHGFIKGNMVYCEKGNNNLHYSVIQTSKPLRIRKISSQQDILNKQKK